MEHSIGRRGVELARQSTIGTRFAAYNSISVSSSLSRRASWSWSTAIHCVSTACLDIREQSTVRRPCSCR